MRVKPGNVIEITSPTRLGNDYIYDFIKRNEGFIIKAYNKLNNKPKPNMDTIHYLGNEYNLIIINSCFNYVRIEGSSFIVNTKNDDNSYIRNVIHEFYIETLHDIVTKSIDRIKADMKITFPITFGYKDIKTYYGKCYFNERHITLQTSLAKYNIKYIISVIYHECAHFYYHDHQEGFYRLLEGVFPGYKRTQHELRMTKYRDFF